MSDTPATDDDLLSLLCISAYNHYLATLVGNPTPSVKRAGDRMTSPRVRDWVIETSTIYDRARDKNRIGRLLRVENEPICTAEQWAERGGGIEPVPRERVTYLRTVDGREYRWTNASFIAVPADIRDWEAR
jgi:hypothetical protein